jgi:hypothetical protein
LQCLAGVCSVLERKALIERNAHRPRMHTPALTLFPSTRQPAKPLERKPRTFKNRLYFFADIDPPSARELS